MTNNDSLAHYGIKGMRWGVVRKEDGSTGKVMAPPVPKPTRVERKEARLAKRIDRRAPKAAKLDEVAERYQKAIDAKAAKGTGFLETRNQHNATLQEWSKLRDQAKKDAQAVREGKMTKNEKTLLIGGAAVGTAVVAYATYKFIDSGEANRSIMKGKALLDGTKPEFKKNPLLAKTDLNPIQLHAMVASPINPRYGDIGTKNNCRRATFAYEMRRRGYDVMATKTAQGTGQTLAGNFNAMNPNQKIVNGGIPGILARGFKEERAKKLNPDAATPFIDFMKDGSAWGKNPIKFDNVTPTKRSERIFEELSKLPNGARGELGMKWNMGGGHSMVWEIVKGRPVIFDTQAGHKWESAAEFMKDAARMGEAGYTRLDNVALNEDFLMRWLKNA